MILLVPIDTERDRLEQRTEFLASLLAHTHAFGDEGFAAHIRRADFFDLLNEALGRQAVIIEPHRVEHVFARHPLEARDEIRLRVAIHMPHVQRAGNGRRRGVDHEGIGAGVFRAGVVHPRIDLMLTPSLLPFFLGGVGIVLRGKRGHFMCIGHRSACLARFNPERKWEVDKCAAA